MNLRDGYTAVLEAVAQAWAVPPKTTVSEWADKHRVLTSKSAAEPGEWRTSRNPLLREPMDALSDHHPCSQVSCALASQFGKSEILNNWIGYTIHLSPAPMLLLEPTVEVMERYSKQRIEPMLDASPALREKVPSSRKRDSGNSLLLKEFAGGMLIMGGANSSASIASMPIKKLGMDEIDKYPLALGDEGSTLKQAEQRQVTFARSKQLNVSTPIRLPVDDDDTAGSAIWRKYQASSRGTYHVPCPHCGHLQPLLFEHLRWEKGLDARGVKAHRPETAVYMCQGPDCGLAIEEHHKPAMLADAAMGGQARWVHERPWITDHLGYQASALYTPIGLGRSWADIATEWLEACRDRSKLVTFWNLVLGLPFDDHADRMSEQDLEKHAESYPLRQVLPGYYILTAAVDTQPDRLELLVRAWGPGERSHVVDRQRIYGSPEQSEVWDLLTKARHVTYPNSRGHQLRISLTAIDTGGSNTQAVYKYCRAHRHDAVIAVKGSNQRKMPVISKPTKKDAKNAKGDVARHGVLLWAVGTDTAKDALFARLADWDEIPADQPERRLVRLSKHLGADFFRELTAEVPDPTTGLYRKLRARNEALDCMVYSHAAACHPSLRVDRLTTADWAAYQQAFEPSTPDLFGPQPLAEEQHTATPPAAAADPQARTHGVPGEEPAAAPPPQPQPAPQPARVDHHHQHAGWLDHTDGWLDS